MTTEASSMGSCINHHFGADVYIREGFIPAGQRIIKHIHTYDHFSILGMGVVAVLIDGVMTPFRAPAVIKIEAGKPHEVLAMTDAVWYCIHGADSDEVDDLNQVKIG